MFFICEMSPHRVPFDGQRSDNGDVDTLHVHVSLVERTVLGSGAWPSRPDSLWQEVPLVGAPTTDPLQCLALSSFWSFPRNVVPCNGRIRCRQLRGGRLGPPDASSIARPAAFF